MVYLPTFVAKYLEFNSSLLTSLTSVKIDFVVCVFFLSLLLYSIFNVLCRPLFRRQPVYNTIYPFPCQLFLSLFFKLFLFFLSALFHPSSAATFLPLYRFFLKDIHSRLNSFPTALFRLHSKTLRLLDNAECFTVHISLYF